jgi:hypothetical protein
MPKNLVTKHWNHFFKTYILKSNEPRSVYPWLRRHDAAPEQALDFRAFAARGGIVPL